MPLIFLWEVLGGLGLFILGMKSMSEGLQKIAGQRLRLSIEKITGNRLTAALLGSCLSSILQSSSAASILVIGFVNAGLISLYQALGVLLGTGLGATIAVQFIAFKVSLIALPAIFFGVALTFFSKRRRFVYLGNILLGAGLIFLGLQIMEAGFTPISQSQIFQGLQNKYYLSWPVSAALLGGFLTFVIQSGSAVTGIVIAMAGTGLIGYETGAAIVVGEVLGTSLVAMTATINGSLAAKRTAVVYLAMNCVAVGIVLLLFPLFLKTVSFVSPGDAGVAVPPLSALGAEQHGSNWPFVARHLANAHTVFNLFNMLLFLPLLGFLARTAPVIFPDREAEADTEPRPRFIDMRVVNTPSIAMLQAKSELKRMSGVARTLYVDTVEQFHRFNAKRTVAIQQKKDLLDILQHELSFFLILLSRQSGRAQLFAGIPLMLHMINDLKHFGDQNHAISELLRRKKEDRILFSGTAMTELRALAVKVGVLVDRSMKAVGDEADPDLAAAQAELEEILTMTERMLESHMVRLTGGKCTVAAGMLYSDILRAFGKAAEYSVSIMEMEGELHSAITGSSD